MCLLRGKPNFGVARRELKIDKGMEEFKEMIKQEEHELTIFPPIKILEKVESTVIYKILFKSRKLEAANEEAVEKCLQAV